MTAILAGGSRALATPMTDAKSVEVAADKNISDLATAQCDRATREMSEFLARAIYRPPQYTDTYRKVWQLVPVRRGGWRRGKILRWRWSYHAGFDQVHDLSGLAEALSG